MNEILLSGDSFVSGQRLDDVVGESMRIFARAAAVGFRENSAAAVIDHCPCKLPPLAVPLAV